MARIVPGTRPGARARAVAGLAGRSRPIAAAPWPPIPLARRPWLAPRDRRWRTRSRHVVAVVAAVVDRRAGADRKHGDGQRGAGLGRDPAAPARGEARGRAADPRAGRLRTEGAGVQQSPEHRHRDQHPRPVAQRGPGPEDQPPDGARGSPPARPRSPDGSGPRARAGPAPRAGPGAGPGPASTSAASCSRPCGHLGRLGHAVEALVEVLVSRLVAQVVERPVANDRVEPRLQLDLGLARHQGGVGLGKRLLDDVLGPISGDDRSREGDQRLPVAANDLLEGARLPLARQPAPAASRTGSAAPGRRAERHWEGSASASSIVRSGLRPNPGQGSKRPSWTTPGRSPVMAPAGPTSIPRRWTEASPCCSPPRSAA